MAREPILLALALLGCSTQTTIDGDGGDGGGGESATSASSTSSTSSTSAGGSTSQSTTCAALLVEFQNCMTLDIWLEEKVGDLASVQTEEGVACHACHHDFTGGFGAIDDQADMFEQWKTTSSYNMLRFVDCVEVEGRQELQIATRIRDKGLSVCPTGFTCHPAYALPSDVEVQVHAFALWTLTRTQEGNCPVK